MVGVVGVLLAAGGGVVGVPELWLRLCGRSGASSACLRREGSGGVVGVACAACTVVGVVGVGGGCDLPPASSTPAVPLGFSEAADKIGFSRN